MKRWSKSWGRSKSPKKQRKYRHNAPRHVQGKMLAVHLSKELRKKYEKRSARVRKGDTVIVMRGQHKKKNGVVREVSLKEMKVYLEGLDHTKKDGSKSFYPFEPSNLMIKELNLEDKERVKALERNVAGEKKDG